MVFTRTRSEGDSGVPTNGTVAEGSAFSIMPRTTRRRKHNSTDTGSTEQHDVEQPPSTEQHATNQHVDPPNRRGPNVNQSATRAMKNFPDGYKFPLTMDKDAKSFVGDSATYFSTECGIVVRNACPMIHEKWDLVPETVKTIMYEKLEEKFELLRNDKVFMEYVDTRLHAQWKRTRGVLKQHWQKNEGETNPQLARKKMKPDCRSEEDWNNLCTYWELEKTQNYSNKMKANRAKQINVSRGGSRSIANHAFKMINPETQMPPSPLTLYHKLHFSTEKQDWPNEHSRLEYDNIVQHIQAAMDKLNSEGTTITTAMEHKLEKEAIKSVCGKQKTIQSGCEVGVGPVFRKKDIWKKSAVESSQRDSSESNKGLRNHVTTLTNFIISKFPEYKNTIPTMNESSEGHDLDDPFSDSDNTA
ncbi:hypothetical protein QVD17_16682 [Tagetes erecta]|uniref:Transposase, Ptta/En/Spm, plant n=1 Tax=Tagetes erecta TaxID=13708 RepID=A0AAD8KY86_TARER|nr:hypothetical protein QVD17_16682 [Tagetes erecta]